MAFLPVLQTVPIVTRAFTVVIVLLSLILTGLRLSLDDRDVKDVFNGGMDSTLAYPWIVLVPGQAIWKPWTLFISSWVEVNLFEMIFSVLTFVMAGRYLERVWGPTEFLKFIVVVTVASNVIAVAVNIIEHILFQGTGLFLYGMSYHGLMGLQAGFLVAFTQLIPEHQVQLFGGLVKRRVKDLPMIYVAVSNVACIIGYQSPWILIQFGWLVSWFYLRFVKWNEGADFRGDRSDTFAFANWFPPFAQKYVAKLSEFVFSLAIRLRLTEPWAPNDAEAAAYAGVPGGSRAEAERRRAMALKALDQRMASKPPTRPAPAASSEPNSAGLSEVTHASAMPSALSAPNETVFDASQALDMKKERD
ncbi:uncharacterized protein L969DRAFT_100541 [Mixia osmundae IAM 14324]|uniref:Peptidase S54 rhomboid domain-containing protein n=1 Tax=Mixia osmundae (strain CBS 9802 / IAM 14324 / JCM 22182 / KY 12970) TaxID=764103 RepID=G7E401_MIXOS|nr:uncharacterized protein L969DRAFT_100541 [Mixia osmundae IAM 14324]KEI42007.1 hypothetical protein L969DRAFT_100541 [Mixia osmundae IAM 14324]GAA97561.1 hypothetical protein E5Q_04239 [Mixia osmundae IAM 14324]